mmetsp:Transcript_130490/g.278814  ORF Transcript_130490/g.278814 Transcript_130490/m.278814 type:complete len:229 (-) Transcript_130490:2671-3357(-)
MNGLSHISSCFIFACDNTTTMPSSLRHRRDTERGRWAQASSAPMIEPGVDFNNSIESPAGDFLKVPNIPSMTMKNSLQRSISTPGVASAGSARMLFSMSSFKGVPKVPSARIKSQLICFETSGTVSGTASASSAGFARKMDANNSARSRRNNSAGCCSKTITALGILVVASHMWVTPNSITPSEVGTKRRLLTPNSNAKVFRENASSGSLFTSTQRIGFCKHHASSTR